VKEVLSGEREKRDERTVSWLGGKGKGSSSSLNKTRKEKKERYNARRPHSIQTQNSFPFFFFFFQVALLFFPIVVVAASTTHCYDTHTQKFGFFAQDIMQEFFL
jgi:hypothetical protein